jgi:cellulose synthase/poly-beta-1,6-N-acetylglucosamine synthase-like glycosyltransferase
MIPIILFWASLSAIVYMFIGYPLALGLWSIVRPRRWRQQPCEPTVSIVISAYNESATIVAKIQNLLSLDYPAELVEILIGSDGSTDGTAEQLLTIAEDRVRAFVFTQRRGKPAVLNTLIPKARGEVILLSDVRQKFDCRVLRSLVQSFADPQVGAVSAEVILTPRQAGTAVSEGSGFYWRYETFIRSRESLVDSSIAVTGPIYAIRKVLFEPIPDDTIVDDVLIPLRIARRGYRVVIEPEARAYDAPYAIAGQEFSRKVRTLAGNFQLFARERWLFNPFRNRLWWQTMSHKALRLFIAPLQITLLVANVALFGDASLFFKITILAQALFYTGAIAGWLLPRDWKKPFVVTFPYFFCLLSWASVLAFLRSITGRQPVTWQKATASGGSS